MLEEHIIGVVIPAYNEEALIGKTVGTMPSWVDVMIVVNDGSQDGTRRILEELAKENERIFLVNHANNRGLGQSLITGYQTAMELDLDAVAIMAGDAQMSPDDLPQVLAPIIQGRADYVKGNRLLHADVARRMPVHRLLGNAALTFLSKFATGYWHVMDPQCGYTAISLPALRAIPIDKMTKGYGYNADLLNMLNLGDFTVADVEVQPVYGEERSKIRLRSYIPKVSWLLIRLFFRRLFRKYLVRNFNPLCLSYLFGMVLLMLGALPLAIRFAYKLWVVGEFPQTTMLCLMLTFIAGLQSLLSAIQYDMEDNRHLSVHQRTPARGGRGDRGIKRNDHRPPEQE